MERRKAFQEKLERQKCTQGAAKGGGHSDDEHHHDAANGNHDVAHDNGDGVAHCDTVYD